MAGLRRLSPLQRQLLAISALGGAFFLVTAIFFLIIGKPPLAMMASLLAYGFGDTYSFSETLVKATPILLCALAAAVPARLGLIQVGADGQLFMGAILGTALVLAAPGAPGVLLMPGMLLLGAAGGALWALLVALLRIGVRVNETIASLLLNYLAALLLLYLVYGPWKDPVNMGWPATIEFPPAATIPSFFGTRAHLGLVIGVVAALALFALTARSRWGMTLRVLRSNPKVGDMAGLSFNRNVLLTLAIGGGLAGIAGICETSGIQSRLQPGLSLNYGLTGFLVSWLAGHNFLLIVPVSILIGGLIAAGDALQLFAKVPASSAIVLQGLLFVVALAASGLMSAREPRHG